MTKKLELTLHDKDGNPKVYTQGFVSGQKLLDYWKLLEEIDGMLDNARPEEIFAKRVEYVASLFNSREVTAKAIIAGVASWDLLDTVDRLIAEAVGGETDVDPKAVESALETLGSAS